MKTTETVDEPGLYSSECCNVEVKFDLDETFSRCPHCHNLCVWDLENEIVTADDLPEPDDGIAA